MSAKAKASDKFAIPEDAILIKFPRSDGNASRRPSNVDPKAINGDVNYHHEMALDDLIPRKWRLTVGHAVAAAYAMDGVEDGKVYVLEDWPAGYAIFEHRKGPKMHPRTDTYLFGGPAKFRTPQELTGHAIWLFGSGKDLCKCKYCGKKGVGQRDITKALVQDKILPPSPNRSPGPSIRRVRRDIKRSGLSKPFAEIQKMVEPLKPSDPLVEKYPMIAERNADLRAIHARGDKTLLRWFRDGELVWCALRDPIPGPSGADDAISFWPALVVSSVLKTDTTNGPPMDESSDPWTTRHWMQYKLKLLVAEYEVTLPDSQVIPYVSYVIPTPLMEAIDKFPKAQLRFDQPSLKSLRPYPLLPSHQPPSFNDTISAFQLAYEMANTLTGLWSLTDDWQFQLPAKSDADSESVRKPPASKPEHSLIGAINHAAGVNQDSASAALGSKPEPTTKQHGKVQTRYQGLWWGGERIWTDDLVRLKVTRSALAPDGGPNIKAPSGPGTSTIEQSTAEKREPIGAKSRGVFMRLNALTVVEAGEAKECRACGMLYELADQDWEDPDAPPELEPSSPTLPLAPPSQLAQPPRSSHYFLPQAPISYKFRPILSEGYECVISLAMISGRYYPRVLAHPLLVDSSLQMYQHLLKGGELPTQHNLFALEGLASGGHLSVDPCRYVSKREKMLTIAHEEARAVLEEFVRVKAEAMEVDVQ